MAVLIIDCYIRLFGTCLCRFCIWVELPVQRRLYQIFVKKCRVTRHSRVFRGLTGSQRTLRVWGVTENRHIPFPILVTNLVEAAGMRRVVREKRILPKLGPITSQTEAKSRAASTRPQSSHPPVAIPEASSSSAQGSMSTSPLKRMERRIKGWFKCILGKQKQLDHRLTRLESHVYRGEPVVGDDPPPPPPLIEKGIQRSLTTALMRMHFLRQTMGRISSWQLGRDLSHVMPIPILFI